MSKNTQLGNLVNGLFVDSTGKVGVGTTSPSVALDVVGAGRFSGALNGTSALFNSDFSSNETSKVGISFGGGYGQINAWGANTSTYGGLRFQISASNGGTINALTISPLGASTFSRGVTISDDILTALTIGRYSAGIPIAYIKASAGSTGGFRLTNHNGSDVIVVNGSNNLTLDSPTTNITGNVGIGTSSPDAKITAVQNNAAAITTLYGTGNNQGSACNFKIVRHYPVVSSGNKLIIPFYSQGNLNSTTVVRIFGHSAIFNWNIPQAFTADFSVGHLNALYYLTTHSSTGNISGIAINGMNIEISFSSGYTNGTANGVFVTIEYMTNIPGYSIDIANIRMN